MEEQGMNRKILSFPSIETKSFAHKEKEFVGAFHIKFT
jgi:hypothetical protein